MESLALPVEIITVELPKYMNLLPLFNLARTSKNLWRDLSETLRTKMKEIKSWEYSTDGRNYAIIHTDPKTSYKTIIFCNDKLKPLTKYEYTYFSLVPFIFQRVGEDFFIRKKGKEEERLCLPISGKDIKRIGLFSRREEYIFLLDKKDKLLIYNTTEQNYINYYFDFHTVPGINDEETSYQFYFNTQSLIFISAQRRGETIWSHITGDVFDNIYYDDFDKVYYMHFDNVGGVKWPDPPSSYIYCTTNLSERPSFFILSDKNQITELCGWTHPGGVMSFPWTSQEYKIVELVAYKNGYLYCIDDQGRLIKYCKNKNNNYEETSEIVRDIPKLLRSFSNHNQILLLTVYGELIDETGALIHSF